MWKRLLPLIFLMPCWAQISKKNFLNMLETQSDANIAQALAGDCIRFPVDEQVLTAIQERETVLRAILDCLYKRAYPNQAAVQIVEKPREEDPPAKVQPVQAKESAPAPGQSRAQKPAPPTKIVEPPRLSSAVTTETLVQKITESIRTLQVAQSLEDKAERVRVQVGTKTFLVHILGENGARVTSDAIVSRLPAGEGLPNWLDRALTLARQAGEQGFPTMGFDVKSGTDFSGSIDEDGVRVYMGLYLVDQHPDEVDPYHLEDRLLLAHEAFPIEYNPQTEEFDLTPLKGGGATRLRLNKTLNKMEPLKMSPGKWIVRIVSTTGRGSIRSDSDHAFELAPGKNYSLGIRWQSNRGVRTLQFDLREN